MEPYEEDMYQPMNSMERQGIIVHLGFGGFSSHHSHHVLHFQDRDLDRHFHQDHHVRHFQGQGLRPPFPPGPPRPPGPGPRPPFPGPMPRNDEDTTY